MNTSGQRGSKSSVIACSPAAQMAAETPAPRAHRRF
jgi:hypothetical protein